MFASLANALPRESRPCVQLIFSAVHLHTMAPRMVFRGSIIGSLGERSSKKRSKNSNAPTSGPIDISEPSMQPADPDAYPIGCGRVSLRHMPIQLLIEDNVSLNYLLCFGRNEFSSEQIEFLALYREIDHERTRQHFAIDERHIRNQLATLIRTHVADDARQQVTLPAAPVAGLRRWLGEFEDLPEGGDARSKIELPSSDLETAVDQCMRDVKNDMLPRFATSPLGEELAKLHPASLLSHPAGAAAMRAMPLAALEKGAVDFFVAAHEAASSDPAARAVRRCSLRTPSLACHARRACLVALTSTYAARLARIGARRRGFQLALRKARSL